MELHRVRGGTREELEAGKYTIGIGISLGNKWFTAENICEQVGWALPYSKGPVMVYVADSIHALNLQVRNRLPYARALERATEQGAQILASVRARVEEIMPEQAGNIVYATWNDIENDPYKAKVDFLYQYFKDNQEFASAVREIVRSHTAKEAREFSATDIDGLCSYILEELPEVLARVPMQGLIYDAYVYPYDGALTKFVEDIQNGVLFPQIRTAILDTEPKVFLEVR